jgi:hypothetical protein
MFEILATQEATRITGSSAPQALAAEMRVAWARFIGAGDPGWHACTPGGRRGRMLGTRSSTADGPRRRGARAVGRPLVSLLVSGSRSLPPRRRRTR